MDLQTQLQVSATPAVITANFDALKEALSTELAKYDVTVTEDTIADAKKLCAELNKSKGHLATVRKEQASKASQSVRAFEHNMREFEKEIEEARLKIKTQVDKFEIERKDLLKKLLEAFRMSLWDSSGVADEFRDAEIDDLVMLSNITGNGNISAKAKSSVQFKVLKNKNWQGLIERRLLELENKCFRAGLKVPMTKEHVVAFLYMEEEMQYEARLGSLIAVEIDRAKQVEAATRQQVAKEQEQQTAASDVAEAPETTEERQDPGNQESATDNQSQGAPVEKFGGSPEHTNTACGKVAVRVVCEFNIEIRNTTSMKDVEGAYRMKLENAGFKTLSRVLVEPV